MSPKLRQAGDTCATSNRTQKTQLPPPIIAPKPRRCMPSPFAFAPSGLALPLIRAPPTSFRPSATSVFKSALFPPLLSTKKQETPSCLPFGTRKAFEKRFSRILKVGNLDFDARVPIPFSIFPSSYRSDAVESIEQTHVEGEIHLPQEPQRVGRADKFEATSFSANLDPRERREEEYRKEVHITREEDRHDRHHRPSRREEDVYIQESRRPEHKHTSTHIDIEVPQQHQRRRYDSHTDITVELPHHRRHNHETEIDFTERQYRSRFQPSYREEVRVNGTTVDSAPFRPIPISQEARVSGSTVDPPRYQSSNYREETRVGGTTVDAPRFQSTYREESRVGGTTIDPPRQYPTYQEEVRVSGTTVDAPRFSAPRREQVRITEETVDAPRQKSSKMGYYDEDGHYHSFRHGLHKAADKVLGRHHHHHHHHDRVHEDVDINIIQSGPAPSRVSVSAEPAFTPNTVTIPCHHIRVGDLLILQGRPCQVIRITTSSATGQHRYLGVDLFTKQLHEESSFISNPSPSVVVQTMLGPVFKQYRVLDLQDGTVVAMTETGDVKQAVPVIDQSSLWSRLKEAFETGRGSVRVLVISDHGQELAVDMKTIHGSRL
ncbi:hypothetical protein B0J14DRAFT_561735 [Halenospora varia]|nr:hypothetical protein B0J14DRAFT_561735 [Halenospora varia]